MTCVTVQRDTFGTVEDALLSVDHPQWSTGAEPSLYTGKSGAGACCNASLLRFDLSFIPPAATVVSATLKLHLSWTSTPGVVRAHTALIDWSEATVTRQSFLTGGSAFSPTSVASLAIQAGQTGDKTMDVTQAAALWVHEPETNFGLLLDEDDAPPGPGRHLFWSSESSRKPSLSVCYALPTECTTGDPCDDGDACTLTDVCIEGACVGLSPKPCLPVDACHLGGACDPATGLCSEPEAPDGTLCFDGDECTTVDMCVSGVCTGTEPVECDHGGDCHPAGTCDPQTGLCDHPVAPDGTPCGDGNACTEQDACSGGECVGVPVEGVCFPSGATCFTCDWSLDGGCEQIVVDWFDCPGGGLCNDGWCTPPPPEDEEPSCPAEPTCADFLPDGQPCRPVCDPECVLRWSHAGFFVTPFVVAGVPLKQGRHQGIAILGSTVTYDPRFVLGAGSTLTPAQKQAHSWPAQWTSAGSPVPGLFGHGLPKDVEDRLAPPSVREHPSCAAPEMWHDKRIENHGRPLDPSPAVAAHRRELLRLESGHIPHDLWSDPAATTAGTEAWRSQMAICLAGIEDGHCDSACGNCSYVLPATDNPAWLFVPGVASGFFSAPSNKVYSDPDGLHYWGAAGQVTTFNLWPFSIDYTNGFTHCAYPDWFFFDEMRIEAIPFVSGRMISGRHGHNSNSDAEAEYKAFEACRADPWTASPTSPSVCAACGTSFAEDHQEPCLSQTNRAATWWIRTSRLTSDIVEPIPVGQGTWPNGGYPTTAPTCAWASFQVSGM